MTETTKNTESQETQETAVANDNKAVFGPLAKYAVIAVIMVSIIVTTAIMLDKQLGSVEQHIAEIESEVAATNDYTDVVIEKTEVSAAETPAEAVVETTVAEAQEIAVAVSLVATSTQEAATTEVATTEVTTAEVVTTELVVTEAVAVAAEAVSTAQAPADTQTVATQPANADDTIARNKQRSGRQSQESQARVEAYKLGQKQHMAEMFARIKTLESNQLTRYKDTQDKQIARLRDQISQQNTVIDTLIERNKDMFEMRAANVQRNQTQRAAILNRI